MTVFVLASCGEKPEPMPWEKDPDFGKKPAPEITDAEVGLPLPLWKEGYFDIHAVNSGRGECTFFIMPDGTTMLVDAGEVATTSNYPFVPQRPNTSTRPPETYYRYISHFLPSVCNGSLDYMMLTHFHNDHMGTMASTKYSMHSAGNYRLTGLLALYEKIKFKKYVDRIYPDYNDASLKTTDYTKGYDQIANFTKYNIEKYGLVCEQFDLGSSSQFAMKYNASAYDFKIDNLAQSGYICVNGKTTDLYGDETHYENGMSNGCMFTYGKFNYLSLGDAGANTQVEKPLATAMGIKVEAMKASHHFSVSCMSPAAVSIWTPRVVVTQSFYERDDQPNITSIKNFLNAFVGTKNLYFTNVVEAQQTSHADVYGTAAGINGHVVIRVSPGGDSFYVYMLDDTDFNYKVTKIDGPFTCN